MRLTRDGIPVVFHDRTLERVSGGADRRSIAQLVARELPVHACGERIPRLAEVLEALRGTIVNVEVKTDVQPRTLLGEVPQRLRLVRAVTQVVAAARDVEVRFSSFDPLALLALAALAPRVARAILVDRTPARAATPLALSMRRAVSAAHLEETLCTPERVARLRRAGLTVAAWTVNDPARAKELASLGVSWLITDAPGALVQALAV
ncbi:MAG: hypothetical protein JWP97_1010 [Labilithrix sp.]|nr:hypothetical protein [Labilithrix sp.]